MAEVPNKAYPVRNCGSVKPRIWLEMAPIMAPVLAPFRALRYRAIPHLESEERYCPLVLTIS